jgi:hypothetical protein
MPFAVKSFNELCAKVSTFGLTGSKDPRPSWGKRIPTAKDLRKALERGGTMLPLAYQTGFVKPLEAQAETIAQLLQRSPGFLGAVETFFGAVQQHHADHAHVLPLRRFMAVVSDLYQSFLSDRKRAAAGVEPSEVLPPLAAFKYLGDAGPFTIPVNLAQQYFGASVGVVSMPAVYSDHPLLWGSLAHETSGHDVLHAEEGMLEELQAATLLHFGVPEGLQASEYTRRQFTGLFWAYWMDEAASDVYGLLNMGPAFAFNLIALLSALTGGGKVSGPHLRMQAGPSKSHGNLLDPHPVDILRVGLAMGVIESMAHLSQASRDGYVSALREVVETCAGPNKDVKVEGIIALGPLHLPMSITVPLSEMMADARAVGKLVATAKLKSLNGRGIQQLETWDDGDERIALRIEAALNKGQSVAALGDDAQLLAGLTLAAAGNPARYADFTRLANAALDASYATDRIFSAPEVDRAFVEHQPFVLDESLLVPVAGKARKRALR